MSRDYVFDSASGLGREQLEYLRILFDPATSTTLETIGVQPGWRCLDLGAGGGSISRWLAERTRPSGTVIAADIDTDHLVAAPGIEVVQHDLNNGVPPGGPFDLIHARALLMHLPRREQLLTELVSALAPGGWLVIADFNDRPQEILAAPCEADEKLIDHLVRTGLDFGVSAGISLDWAHRVDAHLAAAGLANLQGMEYCPSITGGSTGGLLYANYVRQLEAPLLGVGVTEDELRRFYALMSDPGFRARPFLQLVSTWGQKPAVARL